MVGGWGGGEMIGDGVEVTRGVGDVVIVVVMAMAMAVVVVVGDGCDDATVLVWDGDLS